MSRSYQGERPPLSTAALIRLAVISIIVLCILASFAYSAGRHLTGAADTKTGREPIPSEPPPQLRLGPLALLDLRHTHYKLGDSYGIGRAVSGRNWPSSVL